MGELEADPLLIEETGEGEGVSTGQAVHTCEQLYRFALTREAIRIR